MKLEKINKKTKLQLKVKTNLKAGRTAEEIQRCIDACMARGGSENLCTIQCSK